MSNWLNLARKSAIVTGAGSGIGKAIAIALSREGCSVIVVDANKENAAKTHAELTNRVNHFTAECHLDVTSKSQVLQLFKAVDEMHKSCFKDPFEDASGGASILINAAGITRDGFIGDISEQDYDDVLDTNLKGTFLMCQAFCAPDRVERLCNNGGGAIINIGSIISERGNIGQTNYSASKGGVLGLTRALAKEMAFASGRVDGNTSSSKGVIRVNAILPGFIESPMTDAVPQENRKRILEKIPLKRFGTTEDVANMALFLSSQERSGYVTGECWECSGAIAL